MLEVSVDSTRSAIAAKKGGADRIELCGNAIIGGTTPSPALFTHIRSLIDLPIRVLLRPRFGDFCYDEHEFDILLEEIQLFRKLGADGIVIGALTKDGTLDLPKMEAMIAKSGSMSVALHRAFDVCKDPIKTMESAILLGCDTILTSGQADSAVHGISLLKTLQEKNQGRIEILAGAGISSDVIPKIHEETGITSFHMSGKVVKDSAMTFRKEGVPMGLPGISEFELWETSEEKVAAASALLHTICS